MNEMDFPIYFGEWLKSRRKELDLTQAELAQRAGCSLPALRKIESGERRPSKQLAGLLAKSLEIPIEDQTNFIRVARGELTVERLRFPSSTRAKESSFDHLPVHLPFQPTPFIGRDSELAALGKLLADPQCRLLTIKGMGGIGKTRLAVELASRQQALFSGGVYFVSLTSLNAPEFIAPAVADVLQLSLSGSMDSQDQLLNHLSVRANQAMLLILDNLEHLLVQPDSGDMAANAAGLIAEMLRMAPKMKILVTSRERIKLQGEWIFDVHGMPFPAGSQFSELENYSAPALFIQRARQVKTEFVLRPDERPLLARVCQLVEGTPLAIELAAAWVGVLSMNEIAKEISSNLDFLTTSIRDISERHRSLKATFDHSWKLLSIDERQALSRLAVFRGGFQREAAEQVAGASLPVLMSLFSKSLLLRKENGRYDLHEVVRQYALSHLFENPQGETTGYRHCKYYLGLVRGEEKGFSEATRWISIQTLIHELDNLRAAMAWGLEKCQADSALLIATALGQFWYTHGYWREGLEWLEQGLDSPGTISNLVRAKALTIAGKLARFLCDYPKAIAMLQESLSLWEKCDDKTGIAQTMCNLGAAFLYQGDYVSATGLLEEALSIARVQGDQRGEYCSLDHLGHLASWQRDCQSAIKLYDESLALAQKANDEDQVANLLNAIGDQYINIGDYERAEDCFNQCAEICDRLGNRIIAAYVSGNRGFLALKQGNYSRAYELLAESIKLINELGDKEDAILCLEPMAFLAKELRCPDKAARLLGAIEVLHKEIGVPYNPTIQAERESYVEVIRLELGEPAYTAMWLEGSRMTYQQAIAYAVDRL